jgi:hypothetical protein
MPNNKLFNSQGINFILIRIKEIKILLFIIYEIK